MLALFSLCPNSSSLGSHSLRPCKHCWLRVEAGRSRSFRSPWVDVADHLKNYEHAHVWLMECRMRNMCSFSVELREKYVQAEECAYVD